jgi:hypothetical protein
MIVAVALLLERFSGIKHVEIDECIVCRLQLENISYLGMAGGKHFETNAFSNWYLKIDPTHQHLWLARSSIGYGPLGKVRYSAYLEPHRAFAITPLDERDFLEAHFSIAETEVITRNLTNEALADRLYFALYAEKGDPPENLVAIRSWLREPALGISKTNYVDSSEHSLETNSYAPSQGRSGREK